MSPGSGPGIGPGVAPSNDEKLLACLGHAAILLPQFGLLVPLIIWLAHRDGRSPFAAFQGKQAFVFHLAVTILEWVVALVAFLGTIATLGLGAVLLFPLVALVHFGAIIYGVIGAVHTFNGRDYRYPIIGGWVNP
jgi:uncharacterized Tic20 family protein